MHQVNTTSSRQHHRYHDHHHWRTNHFRNIYTPSNHLHSFVAVYLLSLSHTRSNIRRLLFRENAITNFISIHTHTRLLAIFLFFSVSISARGIRRFVVAMHGALALPWEFISMLINFV